METDSGKFITLLSADYEPYPGYTSGIAFSDKINGPYNRPNHINDANWKSFRGKKVNEVEVVESTTEIRGNKVTLPFGISLKFETGNILYLFDLGIEGFDRKENLCEFQVGGALTFFFSEDAVQKQQVLSMTALKTNSNPFS